MSNQKCSNAIDLVLNGNWNEAHAIVQELSSPSAKWIHAVLHKIEGDESNSRYWYNLCNIELYESYQDTTQELLAIKKHLESKLPLRK